MVGGTQMDKLDKKQNKNTLTWEYYNSIPMEWGSGKVVDMLTEPYYKFSPMFSPKQCADILQLADTFEKIPSTVKDKGIIDNKTRKSTISWMYQNPKTDWLYEWVYTSMHNTNYWKFDVRGFFDAIQYTVYNGGKKGDFYNWHTDTGPGMNHRKISMSILLSDPKEYTGGDLELERGGRLKLKKGEGVMFPSYMNHKVHPVTSGVRKSLVIWFVGPPLK